MWKIGFCKSPIFVFSTKMITIYHTNLKNYSTFVVYKGRVVCIRFDNQGSYSTYKSTNPELCKVIEALPEFGKVFYIHKQEKVEKAKEEVAVSNATPYPKVKKIQDAIAVLESEFGIAADSVVSKSDVLRHASKLNISFPNLK